jgi:transposase-like protein
MAPGRKRDEQKEWRWRRWIAQWRTSGLCVRDFCARHGLASHNFYAWRRRLQQRDADTPAVVAVQVVADAPPVHASALELVLANGRFVRVAPGFDAATLRQLVTALEGEGPC